MANLKSSIKDAKRNAANRLKNREAKLKVKTLKKEVYKMALEKKTKEAEGLFPKVVSSIAKACKKNVIKKNKMARDVSKLHIKLKKLGCFA